MLNEFIATLRKTGNSIVVTIPKDVLKRYELKEGDQISCLISRAEENALLYRLLEDGVE